VNGNFSGSGDLAKLSPVLIKSLLDSSSNYGPDTGFFSAESDRRTNLDASAASRSSMKFVTAALQKAKASSTNTSSGQARALAVETFTDRCTGGGSVVTTYNDVDNNELLSAGDRIDVRYNACVFFNSQAIVGSFQIRMNAVELTVDEDLVAYDASVTFQSFGVVGQRLLSGNAQLSSRVVGARDLVTLEFQGATTTVNGYAVVLNHKQSSDTGVTNLQGLISINGASYSLSSTNINYSSNSGFPTSGTLRTADARGNAIVITARGNNVGRAYIAAGQTTPELTLPDTAWSTIK
jgi:hypothetical protein